MTTDELKAFCDSRGWAMPTLLSAAQIKQATELGIVLDEAPRTNAPWWPKEDSDLLCSAVDGVSAYDLALRHRRSMGSVRLRVRILRKRTEPQVAS